MTKPPKSRNTLSLSTAIQRLKRQHHRLDQKIALASAHKLPNLLELQRLKRLKLRTKEKMLSLEGVLNTIGRPIRPDAA
jgi:hypothetical protein